MSAHHECAICRLEGPPRELPELVAVESERWILRHHAPPSPLAGWMLLCARRHVQGPANLEEDEAREFGLALRDASRAVQQATAADRVYAIAFGEGSPHVHVHLIPRFVSQPGTAAWKVADWYRAVERGEIPAADRTGMLAATQAIAMAAEAIAPERWRRRG